ncbi:TlpA family protein disulfide reductase [Sphaerisporangium sp. NPDC004334]
MISNIAIVFIGGLCVLNLALTYGVIRRLREQSATVVDGQRTIRAGIADVGTSPDPFSATFTDGRVFSSDKLPDWTIVAFFSESCAACHEGLPTFLRRAKELQVDNQEIISVVTGDERATVAMVRRLEKVSSVVVEPSDGSMVKAFGVSQFPALCLLDGSGAVVATGWDLDSLLTPAGRS